MSHIAHLSDEEATPDIAAIFRDARKAMGKVPNLFRVMAQAPAVLDLFWDGKAALADGILPQVVQEQLAITIATANGCDYCLAAHSGGARAAGASVEDVAAAQLGKASDPHVEAILSFARSVNASHGRPGGALLEEARKAGLSDAEILETVAHVAINILTNSINNLVETTLDFPRVDRVAA